MNKHSESSGEFRDEYHCDVLVAGSGAGGFSAAITAANAGLKVLMAEKAGVFGGTSATSGGYIWIPGNSLARSAGIDDSPEKIRRYLKHELGARYDEPFVESYLDSGPKMVDFFVKDVGINFHLATQIPDYHSEHPDACGGGRSLYVKPVSGKILNGEFWRLRPLPRELSLFGMGVSSGSDLGHLYKFGRSLSSTWHVSLLLARYGLDLLRFGRSRTLVNGNSLIAQLASAAFKRAIPIWTSAPVVDLLKDDDRVIGAVVLKNGRSVKVFAKRGVILASGGFAHDIERRSRVYKHPARAEEHVSLTAPGNIGDGARMAESMGGYFDSDVANAGAWVPMSRAPRKDGTWGPILHTVNQGKPGMIMVMRDGKRFIDESSPYHDLVEKMVSVPQKGLPAGAFIVCDHWAFSRYGLGYAKPLLPLKPLVDTGYLIVADTPEELALKAGINVAAFKITLAEYNSHAERGEDPVFGKGKAKYGRYLGDLSHSPNPCVAPLKQGPYYAVWMYPGDIGSFAGIKTDASARVLRKDGDFVPGLFAVGNDMSSVFRGTYPAGGSLLGPAMTFGYVASRTIANEVNDKH